MKKILMTMVAAMLLCGTMNAQDNKHEFGVSYGTGTTTQFIEGWGKIGGIIVTLGNATTDNTKYLGPIAGEYFYRISPVVGVGAIGVYTKMTEDAIFRGNKVGETSISYVTVMPAVKFNWLRKEYWGMYSKVGAGMTFEKKTEKEIETGETKSKTDTFFNMQVTALGVEVGKQFCGFAELGFGEQGTVLAGIRYKF